MPFFDHWNFKSDRSKSDSVLSGKGRQFEYITSLYTFQEIWKIRISVISKFQRRELFKNALFALKIQIFRKFHPWF